MEQATSSRMAKAGHKELQPEVSLAPQETKGHKLDWSFRTMLPLDPFDPFVVSASEFGHLSALAICCSDEHLLHVAQGLLFRASLSAAGAGGKGIFVSPRRLEQIPMEVIDMPLADLGGLRRLKLMYGSSGRDLICAVMEISGEVQHGPSVVAVDNFAAYVRDIRRNNPDWHPRKCAALLLSHLHEACCFNDCSKTGHLRIVFSMVRDDDLKDLFRKFGVHTADLSGNSEQLQMMSECLIKAGFPNLDISVVDGRITLTK